MSALAVKCRHLLSQRWAPGDFPEHPNDVRLDTADVCLDLLQRARRLVAVEVAVEVDLVANKSDLALLRIALCRVDPGVGHVRPHLAVEEILDRLGERD